MSRLQLINLFKDTNQCGIFLSNDYYGLIIQKTIQNPLTPKFLSFSDEL